MGGKPSRVRHDGCGRFKQSFLSARDYSPSADVSIIPGDLTITVGTEDSGVIMGVRHRKYTLEAMQYHPAIASSATSSLSKVAPGRRA